MVDLNDISGGDAGGICAYADGAVIEGCTSDVRINATSDAAAYAAGICAYVYSDSKLELCYNNASVTGDAEVLYSGAIYADTAVSDENPTLTPDISYCYDLANGPVGDVDGDGNVAPVDTAILVRYLAHWSSVQSSVVRENSDVNGDGQITLIDVVIIARHLASWKGYETLPIIIG